MVLRKRRGNQPHCRFMTLQPPCGLSPPPGHLLIYPIVLVEKGDFSDCQVMCRLGGGKAPPDVVGPWLHGIDLDAKSYLYGLFIFNVTT